MHPSTIPACSRCKLPVFLRGAASFSTPAAPSEFIHRSPAPGRANVARSACRTSLRTRLHFSRARPLGNMQNHLLTLGSSDHLSKEVICSRLSTATADNTGRQPPKSRASCREHLLSNAVVLISLVLMLLGTMTMITLVTTGSTSIIVTCIPVVNLSLGISLLLFSPSAGT